MTCRHAVGGSAWRASRTTRTDMPPASRSARARCSGSATPPFRSSRPASNRYPQTRQACIKESLSGSMAFPVDRKVRVIVYIATCNGAEAARSLSRSEAIRSCESHYLFGDPANTEFGLSDVWAGDRTDGWRIVTCEETLECLPCHLLGAPGETMHIIWTCPDCDSPLSDDWIDGDPFPTLLVCGCVANRTYLGFEPMTNAPQ